MSPRAVIAADHPLLAARRLRLLQAGAATASGRSPVQEMLCVEASDEYVAVITAEGESPVRTPLGELVAQAPPRAIPAGGSRRVADLSQ